MRMNQEMEDDEKGKLFVGGLSWETTHDNLQRYFCRFGDVIDCVVMKNNESGRSRGFGFVTFSDPNIVDNVLRSGPHTLDGRTIDPKPCNPRTLQKPKKGGGYPKVFLGGLPSNITETDLRLFFGRYGKVMEVVIMYDQEKKKSRGFGFLSFEDEQSVDRITNEHFINLHGKQVEIKKAEPRDGSHNCNKIINNIHSGGHGMGINNSGPSHIGQVGIGNSGGSNGQNMNNDSNNHWINRNTGGGGGGIPGNGGLHSQSGGTGNTGGGGGGNNGPMSMIRGPNGQMSGPPLNMQQSAPTVMSGAPNMMQGYQGWGTQAQQPQQPQQQPPPPQQQQQQQQPQQQQQQQQNYGYGTQNAPGSYPGWGGPPPPPTPQGPPPPPPHQWNNYAAPQPQGFQGYASSPILSPKNIWPPSGTSGGGTNWNSWNMAQNSGGNGNGGDMYSRQQSSGGGGGGGGGSGGVVVGGGGGCPPPPPPNSSGPGCTGSGVIPPQSVLSNSTGKNSSEYCGYGNTTGYGNYSNEQQNAYIPRANYSNDNGGQQPFQAQPSQARSFSPMF